MGVLQEPIKIRVSRMTPQMLILLKIGIEQFMDFRLIDVFPSNQDRARIDSPGRLFATDVPDQSFHTEIANLHWILYDKAAQLTRTQSGNHFFGTVKADEFDFAGKARILQGTKNPQGGRLGCAKDAVDP